jgi:hypothetical protein
MTDELLGKDTPPENQVENETPKNSTENTDDKSKDLQSALAQKEHFRTKAEKAEAELAELRSKSTNVPQANPNPVDHLEVVKLGKALADFSEDETSFIIRNAKDKSPQGIIEASKDEMVQIAIQAKREKVAKEKQVLGPSNPTGSSGFEFKSPREIGQMSKEEYKTYFEGLKKFEQSESKGM